MKENREGEISNGEVATTQNQIWQSKAVVMGGDVRAKKSGAGKITMKKSEIHERQRRVLFYKQKQRLMKESGQGEVGGQEGGALGDGKEEPSTCILVVELGDGKSGGECSS